MFVRTKNISRIEDMINAHIEMDLNEHIAVVAAKVLELILISDGDLIFETLLKQFLKKYERYTPDQFMEASVLLFAIGSLEVKDFKVKLSHV